MQIGQINNIYFLGIGGIGMSAIARYYKALGKVVSGYDKTSTKLTDQLIKEGISIHFTDDIDQIPAELDLVIYTPAIPIDLKEFQFLKNSSIPLMKRSEALGLIASEKKLIAVAGTHGKTSVTTLIAWLLSHLKLGCTAFIGGISNNFNSNLVYSEKADWIVVEADEYDKSFLHLFPQITIVTSVDADHLDIYGSKKSMIQSFNKFITQTKVNGKIIIKEGLELETDLLEEHQVATYSLQEPADYFAKNLKLIDGFYSFDLVTPDGTIKDLTLGIPGLFSIENAVASLAVALLLGIDKIALKEALLAYSGINRRFNILVNNGKTVYIDDYAHHPKEIETVLYSVRKMFPKKRLLGIFQPHLYSRTRDFATEFGKSLSELDELILLPIYPAREKPIESIDSSLIANEVENTKVNVVEESDLIGVLEKRDFDVLITMGAGDIDQFVDPIIEHINNN